MNKKYIYEIAEALYEKHAALMVGAGFSKNAKKITASDKHFLNWAELSDKFFETVYEKDDESQKKYKSSLSLAQEVEITVGRPKLEKIIKDAVPDLEYAPSEVYVDLMKLPWRDVFTTNYDTLLERAAEKITKQRYNVVVCQEDLVNSNDAPRIIKLHGSFPSHRPFIITEEDYRTYPIRFATMVNTVQQALIENVFCMIGFSGEDPNFIKWIGWIHDNLGKSSSQKIYMISVSHMSEAKQKLLFERNIVIIDLEELWPKKDVCDRLSEFLKELKQIVNEKEKQNSWFDFSQFSITQKTSYEKKIEIMHELNSSYPGWIFLPWKMKSKTSYVLRELDCLIKFDDIEIQSKINYMFEYVKLLNISGRPILLQVVKKYWEVLVEISIENIPEKLKNELECKVQVVYLHLLRSFRELADWEMYDECRKRIDINLLDYEGKQFLYACDCWNNLFRFCPEKLMDMLEKWELDEGELYWSLIKASMYALIGEVSKADGILMKNLVLVRRQLVKKNRNEYLCSLEESIVSLINYIRQGSYKNKLEECIHDGEFHWWDENDKYCLHLNAETKPYKKIEANNNYDLSCTYTTHWGNDNSDIFYALEYNRFLEQTGHFFRLQNVTNTKGLSSTIKKLAPYYPHWCLMQILIAQDNKHVDLLFSRVKLSEYTREEIDILTKEYINVFQIVIKNVNPQNFFSAKSIYEQSAALLPEIISRLCYKCSVEVLDEVLNITLELCVSRSRANFKKLNKLMKGILGAYTDQEQGERINKILEFPIVVDRINDYCDPVCFLRKPKNKYSLDAKVYDKTILQIKHVLESDNVDEQEAAINRLLILEQVIQLREEEKKLLCNRLEDQDILKNSYMLYSISKQKYKKNVSLIFEDTMNRMKEDTNTRMFSSCSENYEKLIYIIEDVSVHEIDIVETFEVMRNLVRTHLTWCTKDNFEAKKRVQQSYLIAIGILILRKKEGLELKEDEKEKIREYFSILEKVYNESFVFRMILSCFDNEKGILYNEFKTAIWLANKDEVDLLRCLYDILMVTKYEMKMDAVLLDYTNIIFEAISYKMLSCKGAELETGLLLLYSLLKNKIYDKNELQILEVVLLKLVKDTCISREDSEQEALCKLKCRIKTCQIAQELYSQGVETESVNQWKLISQSKDEFIEVRLINFK